MSPLLVLVGPPGAGKTTVGALVAERLGVPMRDTDSDVEAQTGLSVQDLFVRDGEAAFRDLETTAVRAGLSEHDGVLSLGGGAVLSAKTRAALAGHRVFFLAAGLSSAAARVGLGGNRPLLLGNVRSTLKTLLDERKPLYEAVAVHTIQTDGRTADQVADQVIAHLQERS